MTRQGLGARVRAVLGHRRSTAAAAAAQGAVWGVSRAEPADLVALWAASGGVSLDDGTRILGRAEVEPATTWLLADKPLAWHPDIVVVGERDDLVVALDLDADGARAGGGVLEAPTDGLEHLRRVALSVIEYLEGRLGLSSPPPVAPERAAREAIAAGDLVALEAALAQPVYPGAPRELAQSLARLGELHAAARDVPAALAAFERAAAARAEAAPRGARDLEAAAAFRAFAATADALGLPDLAATCRARGKT